MITGIDKGLHVKNIIKQMSILKTKLSTGGASGMMQQQSIGSGSSIIPGGGGKTTIAVNAADAVAKVAKVIHGLDLPTRVSVTPRYVYL